MKVAAIGRVFVKATRFLSPAEVEVERQAALTGKLTLANGERRQAARRFHIRRVLLSRYSGPSTSPHLRAARGAAFARLPSSLASTRPTRWHVPLLDS